MKESRRQGGVMRVTESGNGNLIVREKKMRKRERGRVTGNKMVKEKAERNRERKNVEKGRKG